MDAREIERARCRMVVEMVMLEAPAEAQSSLTRVLNLIANGSEPITMRQQLAEHQAAIPAPESVAQGG